MRRRFSQKLETLAPAVVAEVARAMYPAADIVKTAAQISITEGSVSGKRHVPSRPGEPPNNDTGHLADNIVVIQQAPLHAVIVSMASYSAELELGSSKVAPRPFMVPAAVHSRREVRDLLAKAVQRGVRRHFKG